MAQTRDPIGVAEIIQEQPLSGEYEEMLFGSDSGKILWVRFCDKNGVYEWIGKFGCGYSDSMLVKRIAAPDRFMINAGGFAYLIDASNRKLLNYHSEVCTQDIVCDPKTNYLIAADIKLRIFENGREIWSSRRISVDGIHDMMIHNRILTGKTIVGYNGEESDFSFDLDRREFISAPDLSAWNIDRSEAKENAWWKFW